MNLDFSSLKKRIQEVKDKGGADRVHEVYRLFDGALIYDSDRKMLLLSAEVLKELDSVLPKNDLVPDKFSIISYISPEGEESDYVKIDPDFYIEKLD